jgi:hypothetical protein
MQYLMHVFASLKTVFPQASQVAIGSVENISTSPPHPGHFTMLNVGVPWLLLPAFPCTIGIVSVIAF